MCVCGGSIEISKETLRSLSMYGEEEDILVNATRVMRIVRSLSQKGYFFEGADASVDLMLRRALSGLLVFDTRHMCDMTPSYVCHDSCICVP